jgi:plastocyanin
VKRSVQRLVPAALLALALVPAVAAGAGGRPVKKTVGVHDNYYEPAKLTVPKGSTIVWRWPEDTGDSHDVTLKKGPRGVKRFQSDVAAAAYSYRRRLTIPGTYRILCSLHEEMTMTIVVRR